MSRPQRKILASADWENAVWEVVEADNYWIITYQGRPVNVKTTAWSIGYPHKKYKKMAYPTESSARNQAVRFNQIFQTDEFSYQRIGE